LLNDRRRELENRRARGCGAGEWVCGPRESGPSRAPSSPRRGPKRFLGRYSASALFNDEHIITPVTVGISRLKHSGERDLHVKHFRLSAVLRPWEAERYCVSYAVTPRLRVP